MCPAAMDMWANRRSSYHYLDEKKIRMLTVSPTRNFLNSISVKFKLITGSSSSNTIQYILSNPFSKSNLQ